jgi:BirA family biotin operon repressor/biotin-[acetyl-CoA-carboxylase] ligase
MNDVELPPLVDLLARAGPVGVDAGAADRDEVETCRRWGIPIEERDGRLVLPRSPDVLVPFWIEEETPAIAWDTLRVTGYLAIASTNDAALERARNGAPAGTLVYAEAQSAGRGRKGRSWISTPGEGLYCTLIVRPTQRLVHWPLLTQVASFAVAQSLSELGPFDIDLKWPNDVLLSGKKTAGILIETAGVAAVIGVGVNVGSGAVPAALRSSATSIGLVAGAPAPRRRLLTRILYHFQVGYDRFERGAHGQILDDWKSRSSMCEGATVWIDEDGSREEVVTCGLSPVGALEVESRDGRRRTLLAGDVSIRRS